MRSHRRALLAAGLGCLASGLVGQRPGSAREPLTEAKFRDLFERLAPPADEPWRRLPWHTSLLEARALAARQRKPVYMLVRSGHPLGCV